jgi:hypothetical protein
MCLLAYWGRLNTVSRFLETYVIRMSMTELSLCFN